jgi:hypothetical protein
LHFSPPFQPHFQPCESPLSHPSSTISLLLSPNVHCAEHSSTLPTSTLADSHHGRCGCECCSLEGGLRRRSRQYSRWDHPRVSGHSSIRPSGPTYRIERAFNNNYTPALHITARNISSYPSLSLCPVIRPRISGESGRGESARHY